MGTWCATPQTHDKTEASKNNAEKSLATKQRIDSTNKLKVKEQPEPEIDIDYTDFRNNPILKPAPLSNPQDTENNSQMPMSMATAAKHLNLKPKEEEKEIQEVKVVEFKADMKNVDDNVTTSEISYTESTKPQHINSDIMVSFKPVNLDKELENNQIHMDMSFWGDSSKQKHYYASTLIKESEDTEDHTKDNQEEFNMI